jgi:hypothetical protein
MLLDDALTRVTVEAETYIGLSRLCPCISLNESSGSQTQLVRQRLGDRLHDYTNGRANGKGVTLF